MNFPFHEFYITVLAIQLCICIIGYLGNIIICIVIARNKSMYTTTNVYLFNLAIADCTVLTSGLMNFTILYWYSSEGDYMELDGCVIRKSILDTAFNVSVMTITAFTIERYLATCHTFLARRILSISKAVKVIFIIWIIGAIFGYLIGSQYTWTEFMVVSKSIYVCNSNGTLKYILNIQSIVFFILPFLLLMVLNTLIWKKLAESTKIQKNQGTNKNEEIYLEIRSGNDRLNKKIFKILITVVAVFFISWAPYHICRFYQFKMSYPFLVIEIFSFFTSLDSRSYFNIALIITHAIYTTAFFISASANPIIYSVMSNKFRDAFKVEVIRCWFYHRKKMRKTKDKQEKIETIV